MKSNPLTHTHTHNLCFASTASDYHNDFCMKEGSGVGFSNSGGQSPQRKQAGQISDALHALRSWDSFLVECWTHDQKVAS